MPFKYSAYALICLLASFLFRALQIFNDSRFGCTLTTSTQRLKKCFLLLLFFIIVFFPTFFFPFGTLWGSGSSWITVLLLLRLCSFQSVASDAIDLKGQPWSLCAPSPRCLTAPWGAPWRMEGVHSSHLGRTSLCDRLWLWAGHRGRNQLWSDMFNATA